MTKKTTPLEGLKRALDYDWPDLQKQLLEEAAQKRGEDVDPYEPYWTTNSDGTKTLHGSFDAWWLKDFKREHVLMELPGIVVMNTKPWHAEGRLHDLARCLRGQRC